MELELVGVFWYLSIVGKLFMLGQVIHRSVVYQQRKLAGIAFFCGVR